MSSDEPILALLLEYMLSGTPGSLVIWAVFGYAAWAFLMTDWNSWTSDLD